MDNPVATPGDEIGDELIARVKPELQRGERLLWAGHGNPRPQGPNPGGNPWAGPLWAVGCLILSGIFFAAHFGAFGKAAREKSGEIALLMFGLILGGIGGLIVIGSIRGWLWRRRVRGRSPRATYALTDRRAIIWSPRIGSDAIAVYSYTWTRSVSSPASNIPTVPGT